MPCERTIEVEDLVLGLLPWSEASEVERHASTCVSCRHAKELFVRERSLFSARAVDDLPLPPIAVPAGKTSVLAVVARAGRQRAIPAFVAFASCAAALIGLGPPVRTESSACPDVATFEPPRGDDDVLSCSAPASPGASEKSLRTASLPSSEALSSSGLALRVASTEETREAPGLACTPHRATCEAPEHLRVTSSSGTP